MRLIVTILWSIAALCWLPWAVMLVRLLVDLALGTPPLESGYLPLVVQGLWPRWQIIGPWYIHSWFPVCAFLGSALVASGWRIYWVNEYYRLTRPIPKVILSILVPPYAVFLMVPVFAGLLRLAWRGTGLTYGAHFVMALHLHAFAFLVLLAADLLPASLDGVAMLLIGAHAVLAARRVYGSGWPGTLARALGVGTVYGLLLALGTAALLLLSIFLASGA